MSIPEEIINELVTTGHTVSGLISLQKHLVYKHTSVENAVKDFLELEFLQEKLDWATLKDKVWGTDEKRKEKNKFKFIQGDILSTTLPLRLATAESTAEEFPKLWLVRSATCDCVRSEFVAVAPVYRVEKKSESNYNEFRSAVFMKAPSRFPLPKTIIEIDQPKIGFYADFSEPYYLQKKDIESVVVLKSLTFNAWNFLSALLVSYEGRADAREERLLRI